MSDTQILLFLMTSLVLIAAPGQDMVLVMSRSIALGEKAGVATAAGVSVGLLGHTVLAVLGLGAVLQTSETLFTVLKLLGAAYLVYLGLKTIRAKPVTFSVSREYKRSLWTLFSQGAISNVINPKIAVFYFAFLPQFVSPENQSPATTILLLGASFALLTFVVKGPVGYGAGKLSSWLRARPAVQIWLNRISGGLLIGLGVRLVFEEGLEGSAKQV